MEEKTLTLTSSEFVGVLDYITNRLSRQDIVTIFRGRENGSLIAFILENKYNELLAVENPSPILFLQQFNPDNQYLLLSFCIHKIRKELQKFFLEWERINE